MRDVKFRGLTTEGTWEYGSLVTTNSFLKRKPRQHTKTWIITDSFGNGGWFNVNRRRYVLPDTVGQYVGLTDKNGKEIYEGDIIEDDWGYITAVTYDSSLAAFVRDDSRVFGGYDSNVITLIGNIYQSPELLNN